MIGEKAGSGVRMGVRITLDGDLRAHLDGVERLLDYSPQSVLVSSGGTRVRVEGQGMEIAALEYGELLITGRIKAVFLDGGKSDASGSD